MGGVVNDRVLCLLPVRAGSTRVKDKNLQTVGGRTLLERCVTTGLEAFGRVVVSTDSDRYAAAARAAGADVPALRPGALARDDTGIDAVIAHVLSEWGTFGADVMVVIQATSPFTTAHDLAAVVDALAQHPAAACALTSVRVPPATAFVLREVDDGVGRFLDNSLVALRTQDVPPLSIPTGAAYASWIDRLRAGEPLVAEPVAVVVVDEERALDIDDEDDLRRARARCAP